MPGECCRKYTLIVLSINYGSIHVQLMLIFTRLIPPFLHLPPTVSPPLSLGAALAVALNLIWQIELPSWFLVPVLASSATLVGLLYPCVIGEKYSDAPDTSKVLRCVAVSVGIYQATIVSLTTKHSLSYVSSRCVSDYFRVHS